MNRFFTKAIALGLIVGSFASCKSTPSEPQSDFIDPVAAILNEGASLNFSDFEWTREPASCKIEGDRIEVVTNPGTDLWQRTYYHFRNDNAPAFQISTKEKFFSFVVKTD
ncbi:MAG: DUF1349 domain-containing protein, partial [Bacteroidales bacterium]|nr:DUF1349 domain-containing protein [Bacteroidales bacterium]